MLNTIFELIALSENEREKTLSDSYKMRALGISDLDKTLELNQEREGVGNSTAFVNKPPGHTPDIAKRHTPLKNKNAYQVSWTPKSALQPASPINDTIQSESNATDCIEHQVSGANFPEFPEEETIAKTPLQPF